MFCSNCGNENLDTAKFCAKCGKSSQLKEGAGDASKKDPIIGSTIQKETKNQQSWIAIAITVLFGVAGVFWLATSSGNGASKKNDIVAVENADSNNNQPGLKFIESGAESDIYIDEKSFVKISDYSYEFKVVWNFHRATASGALSKVGNSELSCTVPNLQVTINKNSEYSDKFGAGRLLNSRSDLEFLEVTSDAKIYMSLKKFCG